MKLSSVNQYFGNLDLYLLDQILKERFNPRMKVLDAGCGEGRNITFFLRAGYIVYGIDHDPLAISGVRFIAASIRPDLSKNHFQIGELESMPYADHSFDLIISSAVMHFAKNEAQFYNMFHELVRCLNHQGILYIKMASVTGIEDKVKSLGGGRYRLPDGSDRFLLTREIIDQLVHRYSLNYVEPLKTVNVNDILCTATLVLSFNG